jgi:hypothetical protein
MWKKHMKNDDNPWKNDISENHMKKKLEDVYMIYGQKF